MKKYTQDHEWLLLVEDTIATVGITEYAATQLGDIVYVDLPNTDDNVNKGEEVVVIESVKAAGEVMAPCSGKIVAVNEVLNENAELAGTDPEDEGWLFKIQLEDAHEIEGLMNQEEYEALT